MTDSAIYEQITQIRGQLLDLVGDLGASASRFDRRASLIQDDLIMVTNRLGRIANKLDEEHALVGASR